MIEKHRLSHSFLIFMVIIIAALFQEYPKIRDYYDENLHLYFLDVGQGDSTLIKTSEGKIILIDAGPNRKVIHEISEVLPFWINKIDLLILSHSHADHITGAIDVIEKYSVKCILYDMADESISNTERELRGLISQKEDLHVSSNLKGLAEYDCLSTNLSLNDYSLSEIYADSKELNENILGYSSNENFESITILVSYEDFDVLLTADSEIPVLEKILPSVNGDIEVLKVPHQGSIDSYYPALIKKLSPDIAVIFVGENNKFGHPSEEVVSGYKNFGVDVYRTDTDGRVHIKSDGKRWKLISGSL